MRPRTVTYSREAAFSALPDPTRRAVLDLLRAGTRPAGAIARAFPVSRPAISKHLRILRRGRFVEEAGEGGGSRYALQSYRSEAGATGVGAYRRFSTAATVKP